MDPFAGIDQSDLLHQSILSRLLQSRWRCFVRLAAGDIYQRDCLVGRNKDYYSTRSRKDGTALKPFERIAFQKNPLGPTAFSTTITQKRDCASHSFFIFFSGSMPLRQCVFSPRRTSFTRLSGTNTSLFLWS